MNHIMFGCKQVFLGTIRFTRDLVYPFRLTPARYNMMYAIAGRPGGLAQRELRDVLGLAKPTIWKMLKSLEQLGLVKRTPHPRNPRHRWVSLTPAGNLRIGAAIESILEEHALDWSTIEIVNPTPGDSEAGLLALRKADTLLDRMRERLGDFGTLRFAYDGEYAELARVVSPPIRECSIAQAWESVA